MAAKVIAFPRVRANDNSADPTPTPPYAGAQAVDRAVQDFLHIGGRLMISPTGRYESHIDNALILGEAAGPEAWPIAGRFSAFEQQRGARRHLGAVVRRQGRPTNNGWRVLAKEAA